MRGYKLSFLLAALLILGAFWAQYNESKKPKPIRNELMPWVMFLGGGILTLVGSAEYRKEKNKHK